MLNGFQIKQLRLHYNRSKYYIAQAIDCSERWLTYIECENAKPSEELYHKILQAIYGNIVPTPDKMPKKVGRPKQNKNVETEEQEIVFKDN